MPYLKGFLFFFIDKSVYHCILPSSSVDMNLNESDTGVERNNFFQASGSSTTSDLCFTLLPFFLQYQLRRSWNEKISFVKIDLTPYLSQCSRQKQL